MNILELVKEIKSKSFISHIINKLNGEIYLVGGIVRDTLLNNQNKDIDLVVRKVDIDNLINELNKFGKVDIVGKSFGVLKFISNEDGLDYDIALPRKEKPTGEGGYRGFEINSDKNLPISDDLIRRDATINSIAINVNRNTLIDPTNGLDDIKNNTIRMTNSNAFSDDPLRMLRMVIFAARLGFTIEPKTMEKIRQNAGRIKEIAGERILEELKKVVNKNGDKRQAAQLLKDSGLYSQIFRGELKQSSIDRKPFEYAKTLGEFIFLLLSPITNKPAHLFLSRLKGDVPTSKEIMALNRAFAYDVNTNVEARSVTYNMYLHFPESLKSQILPEKIEIAAKELLSGRYPKSLRELAINGNDLMELGFKGKDVGDKLKFALLNVYADKVKNNREDLLKLVKNSI